VLKDLHEHRYDAGMISLVKLPEYFDKEGYRNPDNQNSGPAQYGHNIPGQNLWPYIAANPKLLKAAHAFFEGDRGSRPNWIDWFPVQKKLLENSSKPVRDEDILLVDVAGGRGHDLLAFKERFADHPGRYVLQDLPHVVEDETLDLAGVEKRSFNFFQDQVVPSKYSLSDGS
jgi:hypothetical protein